jgi:hypothetical protein
MMDQRTIKMRIVKKTSGHVMKSVGNKPLFEGTGPLNYECGECDTILLRQVSIRAARKLTLLCKCGSHNVIPD